MTFGKKVLQFYRGLKITDALPEGIEVMNPYEQKDCIVVCERFYNKFYNDDRKRFLILGINPGRYGAGLTGIPFTDPIKLESIFGIQNDFPKKPELSADFIHMMIGAFGGHQKFFSSFFINSVSPLGFTRGGKNLNYYDTPNLKKSLEPFLLASLNKLTQLGTYRHVAFCLGEGENFKYLQKVNEENKFFHHIIPLAHPRFIMQYRRKHLTNYVADYVNKLSSAREN